jgi:hypothetical protein
MIGLVFIMLCLVEKNAIKNADKNAEKRHNERQKTI